MDKSLIIAKGMSKVYGTKIKVKVLHEVDLVIKRGEFSSIIGPSGSGKSTMLNLIGGLDRPTEGEIWIQGQEIGKMSDDQLAAFRNEHIGFVFQFHHLLPDFTALENVMMPHWIRFGAPNNKVKERAKELIERVGLKDRMNNKAKNLSGGQQQRIAIARALMNEPPILMADEPTGNLDSESTEQVYEIMRQINREFHTTFVIITHDQQIADRTDRVIEMIDGRISTECTK